MKTVKINKMEITPLIHHTTNPDEILGGELFIDPMSNTAIIAKKKSGKTTVLYHILKKICRGGKYPTNVIIFCSTVFKDETYKKILEMLKKKGCNINVYTHFLEDGENILDDLLTALRQPEIKEEKKQESKIIKFDNKEDETIKISPKPKKTAAEYVLIFDDLGTAMRHKSITQLSKVLRHYKMRCFYLQQSLTDMDSPMRKQLDYALLFRNFNQDKLRNIYESLDLSVPFITFIEIYNFATREPYNFLYIDVRNEQFRKNFSEEIIYE